MWQAEHVRGLLQAHHPESNIEIIGMSTEGDRVLDRPLYEIGGKGLFTKELELALLRGEADLAVHSLKDVPMTLSDPFTLAVVMEREDPRDAWVSTKTTAWEDLPEGAIVGTSSMRREAQLRAMRPDLQIRGLRGNLDTRLGKLDQGEFDGIMLAAAGLKRLGLGHRIAQYCEPNLMVPAVAQGALGIECLAERLELIELLQILSHRSTHLAVSAERALALELGGNCRVPLAAYGSWHDDRLHLNACFQDSKGRLLRAASEARVTESEEASALGSLVASMLIDQGAVAWADKHSATWASTPSS